MSALALYLLYALTSVGCFRLLRIKRPIMLFNLLYLLCLPLLLPSINLFATWQWPELLGTTSTTAALTIFLFVVFCYAYIQLYAFIEMSLSIQMILYIFNAGRRLEFAKLRDKYPFEEVLKTKIKYAAQAGALQTQEINGTTYYRNAWVGECSGRVFYFVKQFLRWGKGG
jgi:predicted membrane protein